MNRIGTLKTFVTVAGALAVLLAASQGHAGKKEKEQALEIKASVIVIDGEFIPDACEEAWGPSYQEVLDSEFNLTGCACKFGHECGDGDGFGWNPDEPTPPDDGGGTGPRDDDDECAADDAECICTEAEEEAEEAPAMCELSCAECGAEKALCLSDAQAERQRCEDHNRKKAQFLCSDNKGRYGTTGDCIDASINGFPGIGSSDTTGSSSGWGLTVKGAISRLGNSVGLDLGFTRNSMRRQQTRVYYPAVPVDRRLYTDCTLGAGEDYEECDQDRYECNDSVEGQFGEVCEEEPSTSERRAPTSKPRASVGSRKSVASASRR